MRYFLSCLVLAVAAATTPQTPSDKVNPSVSQREAANPRAMAVDTTARTAGPGVAQTIANVTIPMINASIPFP